MRATTGSDAPSRHFFKFSKDFEGLSTRLASKQRENAETELRRVLVLTSYTASPMPLKRGREPIWPHFC